MVSQNSCYVTKCRWMVIHGLWMLYRSTFMFMTWPMLWRANDFWMEICIQATWQSIRVFLEQIFQCSHRVTHHSSRFMNSWSNFVIKLLIQHGSQILIKTIHRNYKQFCIYNIFASSFYTFFVPYLMQCHILRTWDWTVEIKSVRQSEGALLCSLRMLNVFTEIRIIILLHCADEKTYWFIASRESIDFKSLMLHRPIISFGIV